MGIHTIKKKTQDVSIFLTKINTFEDIPVICTVNFYQRILTCILSFWILILDSSLWCMLLQSNEVNFIFQAQMALLKQMMCVRTSGGKPQLWSR